MHLTGLYPEWWTGRRFACATDVWVAGDKNLTVRDILQLELLGKWGDFGTGMIPGELLLDWSRKSGIADAVDSVYVKHVTGQASLLAFKSYAEDRASFQGTAKHLIWFDEEPPIDCYREALMRTMVTPGDARGGLCILTFTPLQGWSEVVDSFLGDAQTVQ